MKNVFLFTLLTVVAIGTIGCALAARYINNGAKLSGEKITETRFGGKTINAVQSGSVWDVVLTQGAANGVTLDFPKEYKQYVICKLEGDKFIIGLENLPQNLQNPGDAKFIANVSLADLRELTISGASDAIIDGTITTSCSETTIHASGAADIKGSGRLVCRNLTIGCSGASDFKLSSIECLSDATINFSGASDYKTPNTKVGGTINITMIGSSDFVSALECGGDANLAASGSSDFKITGSAANCKIACSGSSDFHGENFKIKDGDISASGSSNVSVAINGKATAGATGSSDIFVYGNPTSQDFRTSGSSDVHKR